MNERRALLVDDDSFLLDMYAHKFEQEGVLVTKAASADEALEQMRGGLAPDIIVFDMVMPHTDGYEFLSILNREHIAPRAVRIALTNESEPADEERARALGIEGYLLKASLIPSEIASEALRIAGEATITRA